MARKFGQPDDSDGSDREQDDYEQQRRYSEMDDEEEPDFSDPDDFVDEITDEDLMPDLMPNKPKESDGVDSVVVVDGIPVVSPERFEKLKALMCKLFKEFKLVNEHYPLEADGSTKGYVFLEFDNHSVAVAAVKAMNGYKLDKTHTLLVNLFSDFDKYLNIPDEWEPPKEEDYEDQGNLKSWLLEPDSCDQFSIIYEGGEKVGILCNTKPEPSELETRPRWTESYVKWSPLGTYLVTFHARGIALWGGEKFVRLQKFSHPGVQYIDFSPCERYIVTFSPTAVKRHAATNEPQAIIVWEARTGLKRRGFNLEGPLVWPIFKWSADDKYFARLVGGSVLSIFETPHCGLLDKKSIKVEGLQDFSWSPTENILAHWVAEDKDVPARVTLLEIPSRKELRVKNLFNVADCKMHWQKTGDYLCVKVDRYSKLKREKEDAAKYAGMYYNFEIFYMREKEIPVDSVEIKEPVHAFAWEPVGSKFAVIHGEAQSLSVSFYEVKSGTLHQAPSLLKKYERKTANHLFWCPSGQFVVLAGLRAMNGVFEFIDTSDFTTMNTGEHFMCTDVEWDPTGRYLMTAVSWWGHKVDNAYWLWSFQGKILKRSQVDRFCQFLWRPRPQTLLDKKKIKEVKKNLKKYSTEFEAKDIMRQSKASKELIDKRKAKYAEFESFRSKCTDAWRKSKETRLALRRGVDTDVIENDNAEMEEEVVEFLVKEEETIVD